MKRRLIPSAIITILVMAPSSFAEACAVSGPIEPSLALRADAVIVGHLRDYRGGEKGSKPFSVSVKQVMSGNPGRRITVSWGRGSNIAVPDRLKGDYIFVLRKNAPTSSDSETAQYTVMQGVCTSAYVFPKGSGEANEIREIFGLQPEMGDTPSDFAWWKVFPIAVLAFGFIVTGLMLWPRRW